MHLNVCRLSLQTRWTPLVTHRQKTETLFIGVRLYISFVITQHASSHTGAESARTHPKNQQFKGKNG